MKIHFCGVRLLERLRSIFLLYATGDITAVMGIAPIDLTEVDKPEE